MAASIRAEVREIQRKVAERGGSTARGFQNPTRAGEAQLDVQVPGATISLRAIVHWQRGQLGMAEPAIVTEIRCARVGATSKSKVPPKGTGKSAGDCDPAHLNVDIVITDAEGPGTMRHVRLDDKPINEIESLVAREVAFHFSPAMFGEYLENEQNDLVARCRPADFGGAQRAYERAVLLGEREQNIFKRWMTSNRDDLWELGRLGLVSVLQSRFDEKGGVMASAVKLLTRAQDIANDVIDARPNSAMARVALANTLLRLDPDNEKTEEAFHEAERKATRPDLVVVYANHANYHYYMGRYEAAVKENQRALKVNPTLAVLNSNLGFSYLKAGKIDDAISAFEAAESRDSAWDEESGLAEALLKKDDPSEKKSNTKRAIVLLKRAIEERPCNTQVLLLMAQAQLQSGDPGSALQVAQRASGSSFGRYAEVYQLIARAQEKLKREKEAAASYESAIKLLENGGAFDAADVAASIYREYADMIRNSDGPEVQRMKRAEAVLRAGIAANKKRPKQLAILQNNLGIAVSAQGRDPEAEVELVAATLADPTDSISLGNLAYVRERLRRDADALSAADDAIRIDRDSALAWCVRGRVLNRRAQRADADAAFGKAPRLSRETCTTEGAER